MYFQASKIVLHNEIPRSVLLSIISCQQRKVRSPGMSNLAHELQTKAFRNNS